jgi:gluconokinase
MTCSTLKRRYRGRLRTVVPVLRTVYIDIPQEQSQARAAARPGHVFPPGLVASQFDALELPAGEPAVLKLAAQQPLTAQVQTVLQWLDLSFDS